ncbi:hypothetical protein BACT_0311 [Bifidobacterium actinocoloniiforme DSM 22766]|uniref:Uncharacterized protein n=1 Tax=Bifidobacterium actinocoloniiforme DSM 22766 TaxID=1437605 RepID=A0A086YVV5_9BIFI|nr:hypothetical protein [Bifidobacterium actinocoloniiforme]KFI38405.1 hypothetical protein BACT_0311 [Bifidobacterium actinocoloniiforme DSM 22766]
MGGKGGKHARVGTGPTSGGDSRKRSPRRRGHHAALKPGIPLTQALLLLVLLLPSVLARSPFGSESLISVANLLCLGVAVICLSAYSLARGGADSLFDSLFPFILGAASLIGACYWNMIAVVSGSEGLDAQWAVLDKWVDLACLLLILLVVLAFGRQMLRLNRTEVIRGLSANVISGLTCICVPGWIFLPSLMSHLSVDLPAGLGDRKALLCSLAVLVALVLAVGLCAASWGWWVDLGARRRREAQSWLAIALIPMMLAGGLVVVALYTVHLLG